MPGAEYRKLYLAFVNERFDQRVAAWNESRAALALANSPAPSADGSAMLEDASADAASEAKTEEESSAPASRAQAHANGVDDAKAENQRVAMDDEAAREQPSKAEAKPEAPLSPRPSPIVMPARRSATAPVPPPVLLPPGGGSGRIPRAASSPLASRQLSPASTSFTASHFATSRPSPPPPSPTCAPAAAGEGASLPPSGASRDDNASNVIAAVAPPRSPVVLAQRAQAVAAGASAHAKAARAATAPGETSGRVRARIARHDEAIDAAQRRLWATWEAALRAHAEEVAGLEREVRGPFKRVLRRSFSHARPSLQLERDITEIQLESSSAPAASQAPAATHEDVVMSTA